MVNGANRRAFLVTCLRTLNATPAFGTQATVLGIHHAMIGCGQAQSCRMTLNKELWTFTVPL
jgi:hypothetical protein